MSASHHTEIASRLKDAAQITNSKWAVALEREGGKWQFRDSYKLTKTRQSNLEDYIHVPTVDSWLCGALGSRSMRSRAVRENVHLGCERLYAFPISGTTSVLLVGSGKLNGTAPRIWKMVAGTLSRNETERAEVSPTVTETLVPAMKNGVPYDLPSALDQVLASIAQQVPCQGAWLAIRRGEMLEVHSHWRTPQAKNISLGIESNRILQRIGRTLNGWYVERDGDGWGDIPQIGIKSSTGAWGCVPLIVGQRLIGMIALWRLRVFEEDEWKRFQDMVTRLAPSVEVIITFAELGGHLRRLAMLNDFVLTVSSSQNLDQIARRVFALLSRTFQTEHIGLYLLSTDERLLREYRNDSGKVMLSNSSVIGHPYEAILRTGQIERLEEDDLESEQLLSEDSVVRMQVPLKYRGRTNGLLLIESNIAEEFSVYDVHLLTVISSHLAGLVEYSRLREEAEARARNLGLIHEVVQEVIGLLDKQEIVQISSGLLAQYFGYEFAVIVLWSQDVEKVLLGVGGGRAPSAKMILSELINVDDSGGITQHVLHTGESVIVNDVSKSPLYRSIKGWAAGSELCVALKDGDRVIGLIDVESSTTNAFGTNDLMALESLAGILSSVVSSADQYQRVQQTNRQLRTMQDELQNRIEKQQLAERKLIQAEKLAAVGEMAAGIAHELNNPLTTVTGFAELVLDDLPQESDFRPDLEMVLHEALRARNVVRRLLDFSRRSESERTRVDLNEILDDVLALTNHLLHTSGVVLNTSIADDLPWVSVDRNQMKQVFLNLLHNALQAMPTGGELTVQSELRKRDGRNWVTASIIDTGFGISVENKERLFEPFFTTKSQNGGTGLGLSVTYGIVSDHGGTIDVESEEGSGACFTVWLPI